MIFQHLDKNNLHHAYLIEGMRDEIIPEILVWLESLGVKTSANPDFCQILIDNFKKEEPQFEHISYNYKDTTLVEYFYKNEHICFRYMEI